MTTFTVNITLEIDARDYDEAVDVMKVLRRAVEDTEYRVRRVESEAREEA